MLNIKTSNKQKNLQSLTNISGLGISDISSINLSIIKDSSLSTCRGLLKNKEENIHLDNLILGRQMFIAFSGVEKINCYAPKLEIGREMFMQAHGDLGYSTETLKEFCGDLPSLKDGRDMFFGTNLKEFRGDLSSLEMGNGMFSRFMYWEDQEDGAKYIPDLSPTSVLTIVETIPTYTDGSSHTISISIQIDDTTEAKDAFAKEALFDSWEELNTEFSNKGWTVQWELGKVTSNTLEANENTVPTKWYVKLTEIKTNPIMKKYAEKQNKRYIPSKANYCTEDGEKFYKLEWCNDSNNLEGYQEFGSLLEACGYFGVIPVKYLEEN